VQTVQPYARGTAHSTMKEHNTGLKAGSARGSMLDTIPVLKLFFVQLLISVPVLAQKCMHHLCAAHCCFTIVYRAVPLWQTFVTLLHWTVALSVLGVRVCPQSHNWKLHTSVSRLPSSLLPCWYLEGTLYKLKIRSLLTCLRHPGTRQ